MSSDCDVAVIGAGVVGLACARAASRRGLGVAVFEGATVGAGASHGNTGWIVPSLSMPLASPGMLATGLRAAIDPRGALVIRPALDGSWLRWLWQFRRSCSRERFRRGVLALVELNRRTLALLDAYEAEGVEFESHTTGMLIVARDEHGLSWFSGLFDELVRAGFEGRLEQLDGPQARELEPALGDAVGCGFHTSVDRHVQPASLTAGLAASLRERGVALHEGATVTSLARERGRWRLTLDGRDATTAERVVLAAGAACAPLLEPLGVRLPLVGAKGYSVDLVGEGEAPRTALYLSEPKLGVSPFSDGVRIAGVFELPARNLDVSARRIEQLVGDTVSYLRSWRPAAAELTPAGWAGLRPATPDGLPLLGPLDDLPGLLLATGHGMLGVTLAPATGEAIADMLENGGVAPELEPFRPQRRI
jgi:D-amino-acid dehydrogenase